MHVASIPRYTGFHGQRNGVFKPNHSVSELKPSAKIYNCSENPQAKDLTLLNPKAKSFLQTANSQIDKPKYQGISQPVCVSNSFKNIPEQESTPLHSLNPNAEPFNPMFDVEEPNDALGKCIKLCVNKSNQSIGIIFNLLVSFYQPAFLFLLHALVLIMILTLMKYTCLMYHSLGKSRKERFTSG